MHFQAKTLDDLLMEVLTKLLQSKDVNKATRGENTELIGVLLTLKDPRARLSRTERRGKVFSGLGELLWYLSGSDDLEFIEYYLSRYSKEAEFDGSIYGAYGPRIFRMRNVDQLKNVQKLLRATPTTRRAVIQIFNAEDIQKRRKQIPCTLTWQFLLRNSRLDMCTSMRSNDAFLGLPHDIFAFTMIQELVACSLGVELGTYHHFVGSLHLYDSARTAATEYINEGWQPTKSVAMPEMSRSSPWADLSRLHTAELAIRQGQEVDIRQFELTAYWEDLARLLQIFHYSKTGQEKRISAIRRQMRSTVYDTFIQRRESPRMTTQPNKQLSLHFEQTGLDNEIPDWFLIMVSRLVEELGQTARRTTGIIPWACPVPVFGDIMSATIATVAINPSNLEFMDGDGQELSVQKRRLETLSSLGLSNWTDINDQQVRSICAACIDYFQVNPYLRWFNGLQDLLTDIGLSYHSSDECLCHLDLIPFATNQKWTDLKPVQRRLLYDISGSTFGDLLTNSSIKVLILNGATVIKEVERFTHVKLKRRKMPSWALPRGKGDAVKGFSYEGRLQIAGRSHSDSDIFVLGFNHNMQSSYGVSRKVKDAIRAWLTTRIQEAMS